MRLILFLCFVAVVQVRAQKAEWIRSTQRLPGQVGSVGGKRIAVHPDGNVFIIGQYRGSNTVEGIPLIEKQDDSFDDGFLAKYDSQGGLLWLKQMFESSPWYQNTVNDLKVDQDGNLVFSGACYHQTSVLGSDPGLGPFIAKMDKDGNLIWINFEDAVSVHDSGGARFGNRIGFDPDHNILWYTDQISRESFEIYTGGLAVIKYTPDGYKIANILVTRNPEYQHPILEDFTVDPNGNIIVSGNFDHNISFPGGPTYTNHSSGLQLFLAKFSLAGNLLWSIHSDYGKYPLLTAHTVDHAGNVYMAASLDAGTILFVGTDKVEATEAQSVLLQISPDGKLQWINYIGDARISDLFVGADGLLYVTGLAFGDIQYQSYIHTLTFLGHEAFVIKTNRDGLFYGALHSTALDDPDSPYNPSVEAKQSVVDADGNIYTMGTFWEGHSWGCVSATPTDVSFFVVKHESLPTTIGSITGPSGQVCEGTSLTLTTDLVANAQYRWFIPGGPDSGVGSAGQNSITVDAPIDGNRQPVFVSINDGCGEQFAEPFVLDVAPLPARPKLIVGDSLVCPGASYEYRTDDMQAPGTYTWQLPAGVTSLDISDSGRTLQFENTFEGGVLTISSGNTCGSTDLELLVRPHSVPRAPEVRGNLILCPGVVAIQEAIDPVEGAISYEWELPPLISFAANSPTNSSTLHATALDEFQVGEIRVRAIGNCEVSEPSPPIVVSRKPLVQDAQSIAGRIELCVSTDEVVRYSIAPIQNAEEYIWKVPTLFKNSGTVVTTVPYIDLKVASARTGVLEVFGVDECFQNGEKASLAIESFEPLPIPILTPGLCDQELVVNGKGEPGWFIDGIAAPELKGKKIAVTKSAVFQVETRNFCGVSKSNTVEVSPVILSSVSIPNVITPDGDGLNDYFEIDQSLKHSSIEITNRWGASVYQDSNYQNNWSGEELTSGTYFYVIRNSCLPHAFKGTLHVIR